MTMLPNSVLYQINSDNLMKLIAEIKAVVIEEMGKKNGAEKPMTREEAANYMRISPTTFDRRLKNGTLPIGLRHINGGNIYFFASELEAELKRKPK